MCANNKCHPLQHNQALVSSRLYTSPTSTQTSNIQSNFVVMFEFQKYFGEPSLKCVIKDWNLCRSPFYCQAKVKNSNVYFCNRTVRLNGKVLKLVDDHTFPELEPKSIPGYEPLILPPLTFGFYVIPEASANACR